MRISSLFLLAAVAFSGLGASAQANTLKPFATDGCSIWPDGSFTDPYQWRSCCVIHDKSYWMGGSAEQRKAADEAFHACLTRDASKGMADYMYMMVRWAGDPLWTTPYRWGYGWDYLEDGRLRGYKLPSAEEQAQLDRLLPDADKAIEDDAQSHPAKHKQP